MGTETAGSDTHIIAVDEEVFEVLSRTAETRNTDINDVLHYLIEAPAITAAPDGDDEA